LQEQQPTPRNLDTRFSEAFDLLVSYTSKEQAPHTAPHQGNILQGGSPSLKIYAHEAPFDTPVQACLKQEANLNMSAKSIQTSQTCPTPRMEGSGLEEPDDLANVPVFVDQKADWTQDLLEAVKQPPETPVGLGINNMMSTSVLNTPTFEMEEWMFPATHAISSNDATTSIEDTWNLGANSPEHMLAAPPQLVEGKSSDNNIFMDVDKQHLFQPADAYTISPAASSPTTTVLAPVSHTVTGKEEILYTIDLGQVNDLLAHHTKDVVPVWKEEEDLKPTNFDLVQYVDSDFNMEHSMFPGEEPVEIPTTLMATPQPHTSMATSSIITRPADHQEKKATSSSTQRRKRGRPALPLGSRTITPRVNHRQLLASGDESASDTTGNLTDQDIEHLRYRRMRDLNNEASKRCREGRKRKFEELERERDTELQRNADLNRRLKSLENHVSKLKQYYVSNLAAQGSCPDPTLMWSMMNLKPEDF